MKKINFMIIGVSGFIGSNFIDKYKNEYNIIFVDLLKEKLENLSFDGVDCILYLVVLVY